MLNYLSQRTTCAAPSRIRRMQIGGEIIENMMPKTILNSNCSGYGSSRNEGEFHSSIDAAVTIAIASLQCHEHYRLAKLWLWK